MARWESVFGAKTNDPFRIIPRVQVELIICLGKSLIVHLIKLEWQRAGVYVECWHLGLVLQPLETCPMIDALLFEWCAVPAFALHTRDPVESDKGCPTESCFLSIRKGARESGLAWTSLPQPVQANLCRIRILFPRESTAESQPFPSCPSTGLLHNSFLLLKEACLRTRRLQLSSI